MKEITLTKTVKIQDNVEKSSLKSSLYDALLNEITLYANSHANVASTNLQDWLKSVPNLSVLESELTKIASFFMRNEKPELSTFGINCKNYFLLPTNFKHLKIVIADENQSPHFVLYFETQPLFFVNVIGAELLVTPLDKVGKIMHVDMSDPNISISYMSNLLPM